MDITYFICNNPHYLDFDQDDRIPFLYRNDSTYYIGNIKFLFKISFMISHILGWLLILTGLVIVGFVIGCIPFIFYQLFKKK